MNQGGRGTRAENAANRAVWFAGLSFVANVLFVGLLMWRAVR